MLARSIHSLILIFVICLTACDQSPNPVAKSIAATNETSPRLPDKAQPRLQTLKLWIGVQEINAEIAITRDQIATGMMFRKEILDGEGMLFVFASPMRASFWMHNVQIPLTCAYIDPDGVILEIREMKAMDDTPIAALTDKVQYVLEMKQGWFDRNKVTVGTTVRTERGTFRRTFQSQGS